MLVTKIEKNAFSHQEHLVYWKKLTSLCIKCGRLVIFCCVMTKEVVRGGILTTLSAVEPFTIDVKI
jgi:hypothetical protein